MDPIVGAALISGGLGMVGSMLKGNQERSAAREINEGNARQADANIQMQKEFAQQGIRWKVEDAKAAGLHPLAAIGAQTHSFIPVTVGDRAVAPSNDFGLRDLGQDLSRAIEARQTQQERVKEGLDRRIQEAQLRGLELRNEALEREINSSQRPPATGVTFNGLGIGIPGQDNSVADYQRPVVEAQGQLGIKAGIRGAEESYVDQDGYFHLVPSQELGEVLESYAPARWRLMATGALRTAKQQLAYYTRHPRLMKYLRETRPKVDEPGLEARWDHDTWSWKIVKIGKEGSQLFVNHGGLFSGIRKLVDKRRRPGVLKDVSDYFNIESP